MNTVTANELKTKGISALEACLADEKEAIITVRGKDRYVVMEIDEYERFREYELSIALIDAKKDVESGQFTTESVTDHIKQISE